MKWRARAKSCDPSAKDAFMWAADELESSLKQNREQADECRRILQSDLSEYEKMREISAILSANIPSAGTAPESATPNPVEPHE